MKLSDPATAERYQIEANIAAWRQVRTDRLELDRQAGLKKKQEDELKSFLLEAFKQQKLEGMLIDGRTTGLSKKEVPVVEDKEAVLSYIRQTGELDLLQFRISNEAVREREEAGVEVPGVGKMEIYDLFDRKV